MMQKRREYTSNASNGSSISFSSATASAAISATDTITFATRAIPKSTDTINYTMALV